MSTNPQLTAVHEFHTVNGVVLSCSPTMRHAAVVKGSLRRCPLGATRWHARKASAPIAASPLGRYLRLRVSKTQTIASS
jgi:hypothetical protein